MWVISGECIGVIGCFWSEERKNELEGIIVGLGKVIGCRMEIRVEFRIYLVLCLWLVFVIFFVYMEDIIYLLVFLKGVKILKKMEL